MHDAQPAASFVPLQVETLKTSTLALSPLQYRANRLDLLMRMADDLAHELKNPLHSMVINLELIRRRAAAADAAAAGERITVVEAEITRMNRLMDAFIQLLRPHKDRTPHCDISLAITDLMPLVEAQAKLARVHLELHIPAVGALVPLSRDSVKIIVLNLILNAFDAIAGQEGRIELAVLTADGAVRVRVRDSGPGVLPEQGTRLGCEPYTTRENRSGLGLFVVRSIAESAGGRLECMPAPGAGGAEFTVLLPVRGSA